MEKGTLKSRGAKKAKKAQGETQTEELAVGFEVEIEYEKLPKPKRGAEGFWHKPMVMARLKDAYLTGARDIGAAADAGLIYQSLKNKMQEKIPVKVAGASDIITLRELCDYWRSLFMRRVERHVMKTLDYSPLVSGTQDSWRIMERMNSKEWGLRAGQGSVDGNAPLDINSVVALRAGAVLKKRKLSLK
jgi:hypothetical protein